MLTIGRHYHGPRPETEADCDYCDVAWHRRKLKLNAEGFLACPDCAPGRTGKELDEIRAANTRLPLITARAKRR